MMDILHFSIRARPNLAEWSAVISLYLSMSLFAGVLPASGAESPSHGFDYCRAISEDQARLRCLQDLVAPAGQDSGAAARSDNAWPLKRTPNPSGGPEAVSVVRTANTAKSDPDFAGLMIRCSAGNSGNQILLVTIRPFP